MNKQEMPMWAIVPIKTFERAKQRLADVLNEEERRSLMLAMARDVLTCLSKAEHLTGILIVSRASEADVLASAFSTERFAESPDANRASALTQAADYLVEHFNATGVFIVPADVPGINTDQVDELIRSNTSVTLLPDAENIGTNGMICSPPNAIPFIFDGKSFKPHADAAFTNGMTPRLIPSSCFALDIDTPGDLQTLLAEHPPSQTATYLYRSGIARRLANRQSKPETQS